MRGAWLAMPSLAAQASRAKRRPPLSIDRMGLPRGSPLSASACLPLSGWGGPSSKTRERLRPNRALPGLPGWRPRLRLPWLPRASLSTSCSAPCTRIVGHGNCTTREGHKDLAASEWKTHHRLRAQPRPLTPAPQRSEEQEHSRVGNWGHLTFGRCLCRMSSPSGTPPPPSLPPLVCPGRACTPGATKQQELPRMKHRVIMPCRNATAVCLRCRCLALSNGTAPCEATVLGTAHALLEVYELPPAF